MLEGRRVSQADYGYKVIVAGAGAVYEEKTRHGLPLLGKLIVCDIDIDRLRGLSISGVVTDAENLSFGIKHLSKEAQDRHILVVQTPNHLATIQSGIESGMQKFVVEKPLVDNMEEVRVLRGLLKQSKDLRIYPLDFYMQKEYPLLALTGRIPFQDVRRRHIETTSVLPNSLSESIGNIEGIEVAIIEGGDFGIPDLAKRSWLENDLERGGMLLDLGTHALAPLIAAGLVDPLHTHINTAMRYVLGTDRQSFIPASSDQPEIYADALMSTLVEDKIIPVHIVVGKTFHQGGMWQVTIRGNKGQIVMGLRSGQHLTIQKNSGEDIRVALRKNLDPYALAFEEADLYFSGKIDAESVLDPMLGAIEIIENIKKASNR